MLINFIINIAAQCVKRVNSRLFGFWEEFGSKIKTFSVKFCNLFAIIICFFDFRNALRVVDHQARLPLLKHLAGRWVDDFRQLLLYRSGRDRESLHRRRRGCGSRNVPRARSGTQLRSREDSVSGAVSATFRQERPPTQPCWLRSAMESEKAGGRAHREEAR